MSCGNCGFEFCSGSKVDTIWSTWNDSKEGLDHPIQISVSSALSTIFEIPPLTSMAGDSKTELQDVVKIFKNLLETSEDNSLALCLTCAETLTILYNAFKEFIQMCKLECEIAKRLQQLNNLQHETVHKTKLEIEDDENDPSAKTRRKVAPKRNTPTTPAPGKRGRGRPRKCPKEETVDTIPNFMEEPEVSLNVDDDMVPTIKEELDSEPEWDAAEFSSVSWHFSASPVTEPNPCPVRNASVRNTNLSQDNDDFIGQDWGEIGDIGAGDAEEEVSDSESILDITNLAQVNWEEDSENELDDDDDGDDEYKPDHDQADFDGDGPLSPEEESEFNLKPFKKQLRSTSRNSSKKSNSGRPATTVKNATSEGDVDCGECGLTFSHKRSYIRHKRTHHATDVDPATVCPTCSKVFSRFDHLLRHRRRVHGEHIPHRSTYESKKPKSDPGVPGDKNRHRKCPLCDVVLPIFELRVHLDNHNAPNAWKCRKCLKEFSLFAHLSKHKSTAHVQKAICSICQKGYRSRYHLNRHQATVHKIKQIVKVKPKTKKEDDVLENPNEQASDSQDTTKITCNICGREFAHERSRVRHMTLHSLDNPHKCTEEGCVKVFSRRDHLSRHLECCHKAPTATNEAGDPVKPPRKRKPKEIPCPECNKMIKRERIKLHMVSHTGERPHICEICGLKFGLRSSLKSHMKGIHMNYRPYPCDQCDKTFTRSNDLRDHLNLHKSDPEEIRPYPCTLCSNTFLREKNLKSHMVTHLGAKDNLCEICGRGFNRIENLRNHVKAVHEGLQIRKKKPKQSGDETTNSVGVAGGPSVDNGAQINQMAMADIPNLNFQDVADQDS